MVSGAGNQQIWGEDGGAAGGRLRPEMASRRLLVLAFVREYIRDKGGSPSYGEIASKLGTNRERIRKAVNSLAREGLLLRTPGPRGLALPEARDEALRVLGRLGYPLDAASGAFMDRVPDSGLPVAPVLDYYPHDTEGDWHGQA